jgi:hypothetical protein
MAAIKYYAPIDLQKNELQKAKVENLTTTAINALTATAGQIAFDTTLSQFAYYNGTTWVYLGTAVSQFKGNYDASVDGVLPGNGTTTLKGDFWVVNVAGTQTGIIGEDYLEVGDLLYANVANADQTPANYFSIQTNTVPASTTVSGTVQLATSAETLLGVNALKAITPATLDATGYSTTTSGAGSPYTITHNLGSKKLMIQTYDASFNDVVCDVQRTTNNTLTVTVVPDAALTIVAKLAKV